MKEFKESKLKARLKKKRKLKKNLSDKQKNIIKKVILIILIATMMILVIFIFNKAKILRVEINGLKRLNAINIMEEANLALYNNRSLFIIPKKDIISKIEQNTLLKVNNIKISFPDLLIINLEEREALYLLESDKGIYEITDEGYIIKNESIYNYDIPYITGLNINTTNKQIEDKYAKYLTSIIYDLKKRHNEIYNIISEINAFGDDLILYPRSYQVQVILEKYVMVEKFVELAAILKTIQNQANYINRIDFRFKEAIIN